MEGGGGERGDGHIVGEREREGERYLKRHNFPFAEFCHLCKSPCICVLDSIDTLIE